MKLSKKEQKNREKAKAHAKAFTPKAADKVKIEEHKINDEITFRTWDNKTCLRIIGYDAFEYYGLTHEEADFMTKHGDWTCFVKSINADSKIGPRYSFDGEMIGNDDYEFVFKTAFDVLGVMVSSEIRGSVTSSEVSDYCNLLVKMMDNRPTARRRLLVDWNMYTSNAVFINDYFRHLYDRIKKMIG